MKLTPSQAKNYIRRSLRLLADSEPGPKERREAFEFFENTCAYCGTHTTRSSGDLDHLVPASEGGRNHISNRVPACKSCNAVEKREIHWDEFLRTKNTDPKLLAARKGKIKYWVEKCGSPPEISATKLQLMEFHCLAVCEVYDRAVKEIRRV